MVHLYNIFRKLGYWEDKQGHFIGFYSSSELLEAIDVKKPSDDEAATTASAKEKSLSGSLMIKVCVPDIWRQRQYKNVLA